METIPATLAFPGHVAALTDRARRMSSGSDYRPLLRNGIAAERDLPKSAAQQPQASGQIEDLETIFVDRRDAAAGSALVPASSSQGLDGTSPAPLLSPRGFSERVPPEWAVLLLGCALGLATGASVVLFNLAVSSLQLARPTSSQLVLLHFCPCLSVHANQRTAACKPGWHRLGECIVQLPVL